jgi:carbon monoxide dehydrogenase subunit G
MKIENSFVVSAPPATTWAILTDIERIAPCVPGAALSEVADDQAHDDQAYKGSIKVRLGPVSLTFEGEMRFTERDDDAWTARLDASGQASRNRGSARADVRFSLAPEAEGTRVHIETDLQLAGSIAQYGRGAGVIQAVAESLIAQFTQCLEQNIVAVPPAAEAAEAAPRAEGLSAWALFIDVIRRMIARLLGRAP